MNMRPSVLYTCAGIVKVLARHTLGVDQHRLPSCSQGHALLALSNCFRYSSQNRWIAADRASTIQIAHTSAWPAAAAQQLWHHRSLATICSSTGSSSSILDQQQYWQAIDEYAAQSPAHWREHLKNAGIEPLSERQQRSRYAGSWLGEPLGLNPALRQTSSIRKYLSQNLSQPYTVRLQLLLHGHANHPALKCNKDEPEPGKLQLEQLKSKPCTCSSNAAAFRAEVLIEEQLQQYSLDHIIPASLGGKDHPANYFLMPRQVNNHFGNSWAAEKVAYIGTGAALAAGKHMWHDFKIKKSLRKKLHIPCTSSAMKGASGSQLVAAAAAAPRSRKTQVTCRASNG